MWITFFTSNAKLRPTVELLLLLLFFISSSQSYTLFYSLSFNHWPFLVRPFLCRCVLLRTRLPLCIYSITTLIRHSSLVPSHTNQNAFKQTVLKSICNIHECPENSSKSIYIMNKVCILNGKRLAFGLFQIFQLCRKIHCDSVAVCVCVCAPVFA